MRVDTVASIVRATGVSEVHGTCRVAVRLCPVLVGLGDWFMSLPRRRCLASLLVPPRRATATRARIAVVVQLPCSTAFRPAPMVHMGGEKVRRTSLAPTI